MNPKEYIGKQLAQKLDEAGCNLKSEFYHGELAEEPEDYSENWHDTKFWHRKDERFILEANGIVCFNPARDMRFYYPAYSYFDIMVTHAKVLFLDTRLYQKGEYRVQVITEKILSLLQQGKNPDDYILENKVFNPKNV